MNKVTSWVKPDNINKRSCRLDMLQKYTKNFVSGDIYQFGVYSGVSIHNILEIFNKFRTPIVVWGFDSFEGLPLETQETIACPEWNKGEFSTCDYLDVKNPQEAADILTEFLYQQYPDHIVNMIVGYFSDTLPKLDVNKLQMIPASYVDIDVDLYSSTVELWDFMLQNKLIQEGTIVYYDDWKGLEYGEGRAHKEVCEKYGIEFTHLEGNGERLYVVDKV